MKQEDKNFEVKCYSEEEIEQNKTKEAIKLNNQKWIEKIDWHIEYCKNAPQKVDWKELLFNTLEHLKTKMEVEDEKD